MAIDVYLTTTDMLGFDLDTTRPIWRDKVTRDSYYALHTKFTSHVANWNRVGDEVIVPRTLEDLADISVMVIVKQQNRDEGLQTMRYFARVRSLRVNETGRTVIDYDIDWAETYMVNPRYGRCTRCPAGHSLAVTTPLAPRYWTVATFNPVVLNLERKRFYVVLSLSKLRGNNGTFFMIVDSGWHGHNPIDTLTGQSLFTDGDVVGAWIMPAIMDLNSMVGQDAPGVGFIGWHDEPTACINGIQKVIWSNKASEDFAYYGHENQPVISTDLANGFLGVVVDDRGNLLYSVPDQRRTSSTLYATLNLSMTSCEIDVILEDTPQMANRLERAHITDMMFTYSCKPLDVVMSAWKEYAARQRQADIDNRNIQNNRALSNVASNALTGAMTGAVIGTVVPGPGNVIGAVLGGIGGVAAGAIGYGIDVSAGGQEQSVLDRAAKLAQDTLSLTGASTAKMVSGDGRAFYFVELQADPATMEHLNYRNESQGVNADGVVYMPAEVMKSYGISHPDEFVPWAFEMEVTDSMPADRRRAAEDTFRSGARWKYIDSPNPQVS